jgi:hypothetical protein
MRSLDPIFPAQSIHVFAYPDMVLLREITHGATINTGSSDPDVKYTHAVTFHTGTFTRP